MRVVCRHDNLVNKFCSQSLDRAPGCRVVGIAGDRDPFINGTNERGKGAASLERVAVTAKRRKNLEPDVPGTNSNMPGVTDTEIDVAYI
jgi:hypothetical protein